MQEIYDLNKLEKSIDAIFEEDRDWIVSIPITQKAFSTQFSLTNNELSMDSISFDDIEDELDMSLVSSIPKTQQDFEKRFSL